MYRQDSSAAYERSGLVRDDRIVSGFCLEIFLSLIGYGRFSANPASKLKFEIYGRRLLGSDKAIGAIVTTIKDISEGCGGDGGK